MIHVHRETCEAEATLDWSHGDGQETWITFSTGIRCGCVMMALSMHNIGDNHAFVINGICSCNTQKDNPQKEIIMLVFHYAGFRKSSEGPFVKNLP